MRLMLCGFLALICLFVASASALEWIQGDPAFNPSMAGRGLVGLGVFGWVTVVDWRKLQENRRVARKM